MARYFNSHEGLRLKSERASLNQLIDEGLEPKSKLRGLVTDWDGRGYRWNRKCWKLYRKAQYRTINKTQQINHEDW